MKQNLLRQLTLSTLTGIALSLTAWAIASSAHQDPLVIQGDSTLQKQLDQNEMPIATFPSPGTSNTDVSPLRRLRNKHRDLPKGTVNVEKFVLTENSAPVLLQLQESHPGIEPAFPLGQCDAVVTGEVTEAHAYLSEDRTSVYSEFILRVSDVLRNDAATTLNSGMFITAERPGGRVRFPSGKTLIRGGVYGRNMPRPRRQYVLFLSYNVESQDFSIVTGYEMRAGHIFPLDGAIAGAQSAQFASYERYKGRDESSFLAELRDALAAFVSKAKGQQ